MQKEEKYQAGKWQQLGQLFNLGAIDSGWRPSRQEHIGCCIAEGRLEGIQLASPCAQVNASGLLSAAYPGQSLIAMTVQRQLVDCKVKRSSVLGTKRNVRLQITQINEAIWIFFFT